MLIAAVVVLGLALAGCGAVAIWQQACNQALRGECRRLEGELAGRQAQLENYAAEIDAMRGHLAAAQKQLAVAEETHRNVRQQFDQAQAALKESFAALASQALDQTSQQFLQLAASKFQTEQSEAAKQLELRKQAVEALVRPLGESLQKYGTLVQEIEKTRAAAYGTLHQQLATLATDQQKLRSETANLVKALRRPEVRGQWGQLQLRRVVELAGMSDQVDFFEQVSVPTESGRLQPDLVVRLPAGRVVVIDAKTPLDAFISATECDDEAGRDAFLDQHVQQIENQVRNLSGKQYQALFARTPDFTVLFIPGESILYAAVQRQPRLIEDAMAQKVVIATPTVLIALLKVVALGWNEERLAENAQHIRDLGQELHKRICVALGHLEGLGDALGKAVKQYNSFVGSLESQVLSQSRRLKELGAGSSRDLPAELPGIETSPRQPRLAEGPGSSGPGGAAGDSVAG